MNTINKIIISIISIVCLFNTFSFVFAQDDGLDLEIIYPTLSNEVEAPATTRTFLPKYIQYIYNVAVFASGLIAFIMLLVGGFRLLTSVGNPGTMQDARDQIFSGILGMVIIFGSYVILRELNPDLTSFSLPQLSTANRGIVLYTDSNCGDGKGMGEPYKVELPEGVEYLTMSSTKTNLINKKTGTSRLGIINSFFSFHDRQEMNIQFFENESCSPESLVDSVKYDIQANKCIRGVAEISSSGGTAPSSDDNFIGSGSLGLQGITCIKITWRDPGVWLFTEPNGNPSNPDPKADYYVYRTSQDSLPDKISDNVRSVALIREEALGIYYGAIIYNITNGKDGWAEVLLPNFDNDITVYNLDELQDETHLSAITVFRIPGKEASSNDIFTLYRETSKYAKTETGEVVIPQLQIGWSGSTANIQLKDITDKICSGHSSVYAATFQEAAQDAKKDVTKWTKVTSCGKADVFNKIIGGILVEGETWKGKDGAIINLPGSDKVIAGKNKSEGVSGFFMPSNGNYIALLYEHNAGQNKNENWLLDVARESAKWSVRAPAIPIFGSYSNLDTIQQWGDMLATLIVIRVEY